MTGLGKSHCSHLNQIHIYQRIAHGKQRISKARLVRFFKKITSYSSVQKKLTEEKYCEKFMAEQSDHPISKPSVFLSLMEEIEIRYLERPIKIRLSSEITFFLSKYEITFSPL